MALEVNITERRCFPGTENGGGFLISTDSLKANVMENVVFETDIEIGVILRISDEYSSYDYGGGEKRIYKEGLNFYDEGFRIGDTIEIAYESNPNTVATVTFSGENEMRINYISGQNNPDNYTGEDDLFYVTSRQEGVQVKSNIIANNGSISFVNPITETEIQYTLKEIPDVQSVFFPLEAALANKNGQTGGVFIRDNGTVLLTERSTFREPAYRSYTIREEIIITPYYLDGVDVFDYYAGSNSVKYIVSGEFRRDWSLIDTAKQFNDSGSDGDVGYFNENFNGGTNNFSIENLVYTSLGKQIQSIESTELTEITFNVISQVNSFSNGIPIVFYHSKLPEISEYQNASFTFFENWLYDSIRVNQGNQGNPAGIMEFYRVIVDGPTQLSVTLRLSFTDFQKSFIEEGGLFTLALSTSTDLSQALNDKVTIKIDENSYLKNQDIPGLLTWDKLEIYDNREDFTENVTVGKTDGILRVESGIMVDSQFSINTSEDALLKSLTTQIIAYNPISELSFVVSKNDINLSALIQIGDGQNINSQGTRGFNLPDGSQFNFENIKTDPNSVFKLQSGMKIDWREWIQLDDANPIFIDDNQENRGLNLLSSNYSENNGYEIRLAILATVTKGDIDTVYRAISPKVIVSDYDEEPDMVDNWINCEIELFDSNDISIGETVLIGEVNTIEARFTFDVLEIDPEPSEVIGIIRLEQSNSQGKGIYEINSLRGSQVGSPLIPFDSIDDIQIEIISNIVYLRAKIDGNLLNGGSYKVSADIDLTGDPTPSGAFDNGFDNGFE